jgi:hypothetical protein
MSQVSISDAGGPGDCRSGAFIVEEVDAVGDRRSGYIKTVNAGTLLEGFFEESEILDCFFQQPNSQDFQSISIQIKRILL